MVAESILRSLGDEPDMRLAGVATSAASALALGAEHQPDVVIMDYRLADEDGLTTTRRLREVCPASYVLLLTGFGDDDVLLGAIEAGCSGYLPKTQAYSELARAVRLVAVGEIVHPSEQLARLLPKLLRNRAAPTPDAQLSARELEVLALVADGGPNKAIASQLDLRLNTVRNHAQDIQARSALQAGGGRHRRRQGLLHPPAAHGDAPTVAFRRGAPSRA